MKSDLLTRKPHMPDRRWARFLLTIRRLRLGAGQFDLLLGITALAAAFSTYFTLSRDSGPLEVASGGSIGWVLVVNGVLFLALAASIANWLFRIWNARRRGDPGSRLHSRVTGTFIAIAMGPPILMAIFAALFLEYGLQSWFSGKVRATLNNSLEVAEAYVVEHRVEIEKDLSAIRLAYEALTPVQQITSATLQRVADTALSTRLLSEVLIVEEFDGQGQVLARANENLTLKTSRFPESMIERARRGDTVIMSNSADSTVLGMVRLSGFLRPTYLYITRDLNPLVLGYLEASRAAVADYQTLESKRASLQLNFNVVFILVALLVLLAAIWMGLRFSSRLVTPISDLVDAAESVGKGDLAVRVPHVLRRDEVGTLSRAFNRMTDQIRRHQEALLAANKELDERRRFLEEVLDNVSAGIMGLDVNAEVYLCNPSACALLETSSAELLGSCMTELIPETEQLIIDAARQPSETVQAQLQVDIRGEMRIFLIRVVAERVPYTPDERGGFVVAFDDVTEQMADQRIAAWADVARRIAHEIKNPLTPIQLSAERLRRKYRGKLEADVDTFDRCTDTIVRQVGDLRRMVDEFSSFARMPAPMFELTDLPDVIKQAIFLQDVAHSDIQFELDIQQDIKPVLCDSRLIGQALTNILKNAAESVSSRLADAPDVSGHICIKVAQNEDLTEISVQDNGVGLPQDLRDRLTEPYVTTRRKGTGLGLAIVKRVMEDHGGSLRLLMREGDGAEARLVLSGRGARKKYRQQHLQQDGVGGESRSAAE